MINNVTNMLNSKLRFTGMASGIDTDYIIENMMQIEKLKVDKVKQDKQILEWKRDDYRSVSSLLRGFKDEFFDILKPSSNMRSTSTYYAYDVKSSNEDIVTAHSNAQIVSDKHEIKVLQLADVARLEGGEIELLEGEASLKISDTLGQIMGKLGIDPVDELELNINGKEIKIHKDKSLNSLMEAINNSDAGVKISYSSFLEKFTMTSKAMGENSKIEITEGAEFFQKLGLDTSEVAHGKNAIFQLDGKLVDDHNSNIFTADGVVYTLRGTSVEDFDPDGDIDSILEGVQGTKITLEQDVDAVFDKIKSFIDKYNEVVEMLDTKINEARPTSSSRPGSYYLPLTDEQREAMKDDEIEKWEENAKKGLLKNDGMLNSVLFSLRRVMGDLTEDGGLFSIGISTGDWREGAKLKIDEDKLKKAITDNPDKVMNMFSRQSSISYDPDATKEQRTQRYNESGIIDRVFDVLQDNIRTTRNEDGKKGVLLEKAGIIGDVTEFQSTLVDEIKKKDSLIGELMDKLYIKQESLYMKFAGLEAALSRMNSQSAWLSQQLGGMGQQ